MAITSKGKLPLLHIPKTSHYFCYIFLRNYHSGNNGGQNQEDWKADVGKNTSSVRCLDGRIFGTGRNEQY